MRAIHSLTRSRSSLYAPFCRPFFAASGPNSGSEPCPSQVPSDLGTLHALLTLRARTNSPGADVRCYVVMNGRLSGGTMATGILMDSLGSDVAAQRADPFLIGGRPLGRAAACAPRERERDLERAELDATVQGWVGPFMMAAINTRVVRRSVELLRAEPATPELRGLIGDDLCYSEVQVAKDEAVATALARGLPPVSKRQEMVSRGKLPKPGEGPSEEMRAGSWFRFVFVARAEDGTLVATSVRGGDPGYTETAKMAAESALCLALPERRAKLPSAGVGSRGGALTPAAAFGGLLIDCLHTRGIEFSVEEAVPTAAAMLQPPGAPPRMQSKL